VIPHFFTRVPQHYATTAQAFVLAVVPHGGQRSARRNAWASMSQDAATARARKEAGSAMDRAVAFAQRPAASAR